MIPIRIGISQLADDDAHLDYSNKISEWLVKRLRFCKRHGVEVEASKVAFGTTIPANNVAV